METPLPVGIDDYKKLMDNKYYYVDKTMFIKELLDKRSEVSLFMRPRRFGKTLILSMLKYFFEKAYDQDGRLVDNRYLFADQKIMDAGEYYTKYMGRYSVISLSLKSAKQPEFHMAYECIKDEIANEFDRHRYVMESNALNTAEKEQFQAVIQKDANAAVWAKALEFLSKCLRKASGEKVIILLDEYDVPLENAYFKGFYEQMSDFIRSLFESALKTNSSLEFAVVTGCLRITRESIFTGLNNLEMISLLNVDYAEHFGFTKPEVEQLLASYGLEQKAGVVRHWYDGYLFGKTEVYNPWSVINYVKAATADEDVFPKTYWANTSSNSIVKRLIEQADGNVKQEIEDLIADGTIEKPVHEEITYDEVDKSEDNLWNFLFFTGYLKKRSERFDGETAYLTLAIPNTEVKMIYRNTILNWFGERIRQKDFTVLCRAFLEQDTQTLERELSQNLMETISFYDYKEAYYHGFLAGLLKLFDGYTVKSNRESGLGRSDLLLLSAPYDGIAVIIEIKAARTFAELGAAAESALRQIEEREYDAELRLEGYHSFIKYGIAFYKKICKAAVEIPLNRC